MTDNIKIITDWPEDKERIEEITAEVPFERVKHVIASLKKALYANRDVVALCAPQIGEDLRLFVVKSGRKESNRFKVFLNPMIVSHEGLHLSRETNASFPDKQFIIPRKDKIHVAYQTYDGHITSESFIGTYSEVVEQMIEMLDGITIADYGLDLDDVGGPKAFDKAKKDEKAELISMYLESLKEVTGKLVDEIEKDPTLNYINKSIDFQKEVILGNIKAIDENGNLVDEEYIKSKAKEIAKEKVAKVLKKDVSELKED